MSELTIDDIRDRLGTPPLAMVTSIDERGTLSSRPLTIQRLDDSGDLWFLVDRNADWVEPVHHSPVNAAVSQDRTWLSFAGRASVVTEPTVIQDLRDPASDAFFDTTATPVALLVAVDRIEWWASPNKAVQAIELLRSKVTGNEPDLGDSGAIEL